VDFSLIQPRENQPARPACFYAFPVEFLNRSYDAMIKKFLIFSALAAAAYSFGVAAIDGPNHAHGAQAVASSPEPSENPPAPDFKLADVMNGGKITLSSYKGKWVFLNFWATWCGPCVVEMPMMNNLYHHLKKEGLAMVAVSVDEGEGSSPMIKQFVSKLKLDFTILHDPSNSVMREYGIRSIPRTFFVDPEGNIQAAAEGVREWDNPEMLKFFRGIMEDYSKKKAEQKGKTGAST